MSIRQIETKLNSITKYENVFKIPQNLFKNKKCKKCAKNLKIVIVNAPCHGFGDLIFAYKLAKYLRDWYGAKVDIATTLPDGLKKLGEKSSNIVSISGGSKQCRRFRHMKIDKKTKYDLIFIAPLPADFTVNRSDIKALIPYSNKFNTFFFSEYNDSLKKGFDFNTGVGGGRSGLLLTTNKIEKKRPKKLKNPYALAYIAETISNSLKCFLAFVELISAKYSKKYKKFDIVVPSWIADELIYNPNKVKKFKKYFGIIKVKTAKKEATLINNGGKTLTIRGDILPVPNKEMLSIMKHSVKDILLTGDQSITDALSCCIDKNIFYQIAPWKKGFGKELAKNLPNNYLKKKSTSCGTLKAIKYKSNYKNFVKKYDFRKNARSKLDSIILAAKKLKTDKTLQKFEKEALKSRTLKALKRKI